MIEETMDPFEPILEPDLEICDPHHHLMDNQIAHYMAADLLSDLRSGHNVVLTMYMECGSNYRTSGPLELLSVGEVEYVVAQDVPAGVLAGAVGYADLRAGAAVEPVLDALEAAGGGRLKGMRYSTAWDSNPAWRVLPNNPAPGLLADEAIRPAIAAIQRRGMPLDLWVYHHQLMDVVTAARAMPDQTFVLDHLGTPLIAARPGRRAEILAQWRTLMTAVAAWPNVLVKVGGIGMAMQGAPWNAPGGSPSSADVADHWQSEVSFCIDTFGPDRCIFESNFPIDRSAMSYPVLWNALKRMSAQYAPGERAKMFHDNAVRIYRLADV